MVAHVRWKLRQAFGSLKDQASIGRALLAGKDALSDIKVAVLRATAHDNVPADDRFVHEIFYLVSTTPGATHFLARKISHRLANTRNPFVALKALLLVHRLLRGGDRGFEQELCKASLSGDLKINGHDWFTHYSDGLVSFLYSYAAFLEERMGWVINQAGKLEPFLTRTGRVGSSTIFCEEKSTETVFHRLPRCQNFLDRAMECLPVENIAGPDLLTRAALCNILRESFPVYIAFCEGVTALVESLLDFKLSARGLATEIFKRASIQSYKLFEFFESCKKVIDCTSLDYPFVGIISNEDYLAAMEEIPKNNNLKFGCVKKSGGKEGGTLEGGEKVGSVFSSKLETRISTVWVEFDDEWS